MQSFALLLNKYLLLRYDPYNKIFTAEYYDFEKMKYNRKQQIESASKANTFGLILSTLGRQGSVSILDNIITILNKTNKSFIITLMSEIFPQKLKLFTNVDRFLLKSFFSLNFVNALFYCA